MFQVKADDGLLFPRLQPEITGNPTVVFIDAPVAASPVVELAGPHAQPVDESSGADLGFFRPAPDEIHHQVPHIVWHPHLGQSSPRLFFKAMCSAINSASTSSFVWIFFSRNSIRCCPAWWSGRLLDWKAAAPFSKNSFANGRTPLAAAPVPHTDRKPALYPANAVLGCQPSLRQCSASALFACVLSVILTEERSLQFQLRQDSGHARSGEALRHLGHPHHDSPGPQRHHSQTRRRIRVHFGVRIRRAAVAVRLEPRKAWFSSEGNLCGQRTLLAARPMSSIGSIWRIGDFACRSVDFWVVSLWLCLPGWGGLCPGL